MIDAGTLSAVLGGRPKAGGGFMACCPAHEDSSPSLSIDHGDNGKPIFRCFSGCSQQAILDALRGIGLWPGDDNLATSHQDMAAVQELSKKREAERQTKRAIAANKAKSIWQASTLALANHPYLDRKQVQPAETLREIDFATLVRIIGYHPHANGQTLTPGRILVVPVMIGDCLTTCEFIDEAGSKTALLGGQKSGGMWAAQKFPPGDGYGLSIILGEGVATILSAREATGHCGVAALSCGNLMAVAEKLRQRYPAADIIVLADLGNGQSKAEEAARIIGGRLAVPHFGAGCGKEATDFNDLHVLRGLNAVRQQIEAAKAIADGDVGDNGDILAQSGENIAPDGDKPSGALGTTNFWVGEKGVFFKPDSPEESPLWICSRLDVSAMTRDQDGESWGRLLEFRDPDGRLHQWACPLELFAGDGSEFRRLLLAMGLQISPAAKARQLLASYVQTWQVKARATCTDRTGWHGLAYVLPDETVGPSEERILLQTLGEPPRMRQAGTLSDWRDTIASFCVGNSRLTVSVSLAFATPLLALVGDESGGVHWTGGSSTGKTTSLRLATSVWGGAEFLYRWRATGNGLEAIAQAHNDGLLVLDELAQVDPREAGEIAYMLANGKGKQRARRDGLMRRAATWRLLFLSAGEIGLADHMLAAGKASRAGQEVRLADVPADAGKGYGIFERLHSFPSGAALAEHLNKAVEHCHGTVIRLYLRQLTQVSRDQLISSIEALRRDFLNDHVPARADGQARRVASRFALIAAGGELATRFGLTGWPIGEAIEGAAVCYVAWLDRRGGAGCQETTMALAQVRHFIEAHGESRFSDLDKPSDRPTINRAGYRRRHDSGGVEFLMLPEVFRQEICAGLDYRQVARVLRERGILKTEGPDRFTIKPRDLGRVYCLKGGIDNEG